MKFNRFICGLALWMLSSALIFAQKSPLPPPLPGVVTTNFLGERIFYVATNGNNLTASINDASRPYAPVFQTNSGVLSVATNAGDVVLLLAGTYIAGTNGIPIPTGVIFSGVDQSKTIIKETNENLHLSTFQPNDNCKIQNLTWFTTNGFSSFAYAGGGQNFTNVIVNNCTISGNSDVWYSEQPLSYRGMVYNYCNIRSHWDFCSMQCSGYLTLNDCILYGDESNGLARFLNGDCLLTLNSCIFNGFVSWTNAINVQFQNTVINGTVFNVDNMAPILPENFSIISSGYYVNGISGKSYSLGPDRGQFWTNSITTNLTYVYSITNLIISGGGAVAANGAYKLLSFTGDTTNGLYQWTNNSANGYKVWLNEPNAVALFEATPVISIEDNSSNILYAADFNVYSANKNQIYFDNGGGEPSPFLFLYTNSITTNSFPNFKPSIFNGNLRYDGTSIISLIPLAGNGSSLSNISASQLVGTFSISTNATISAGISGKSVASFVKGTNWWVNDNGSGFTTNHIP